MISLSLEEKATLLKQLDAGTIPDDVLRGIAVRLRALSDYRKNHPIECYEPIKATRSGGPHQLAFHIAPHEGRSAFGANQSGKTACGSTEAAMHFTGVYPLWYPPERRMAPGNVGRIIVKDFSKSVAEVIEPALAKVIPNRYIKERKTNNKGYLIKMVSITGSRFDIVTHEMDTKTLEGWQGHWAWFDEPPPRDKWVATLRGLVRNHGRWWLTCTPLDEPWMYDEIYTNAEYFTIHLDMRDNPYLSEESIARYESKLTEEEREARIHGRFMHLSGLTYKEFDGAVHIRPAGTSIPADWPRWMVCDPHDRKPFAMAWCAIDPLGRRWWYDEWPGGWFHEMKSSTNSLRDYIHIIREKEMGQKIWRRVIDGRAGKAPLLVGTQSGAHQDSLIDGFADLGIVFEPSYITLSTGITDPGHLRVKEALRMSLVTGEPGMFILANCKNLIYAYQHNTWENSRGSTGVVLERQSQYAKDFLDLVRYAEMDDMLWIDNVEGLLDSHSGQNQGPAWVEKNREERDGSYGYGRITDW